MKNLQTWLVMTLKSEQWEQRTLIVMEQTWFDIIQSMILHPSSFRCYSLQLERDGFLNIVKLVNVKLCDVLNSHSPKQDLGTLRTNLKLLSCFPGTFSHWEEFGECTINFRLFFLPAGIWYQNYQCTNCRFWAITLQLLRLRKQNNWKAHYHQKEIRQSTLHHVS